MTKQKGRAAHATVRYLLSSADEDPPDLVNISDACLLALHHAGWIGGLRRKDAPMAGVLKDKRKHPGRRGRGDALPAYTPTLRGVTYDRRQHRLVSSLTLHSTSYYIGSGIPTRETEERLHRLWMALRAELEVA